MPSRAIKSYSREFYWSGLDQDIIVDYEVDYYYSPGTSTCPEETCNDVIVKQVWNSEGIEITDDAIICELQEYLEEIL